MPLLRRRSASSRPKGPAAAPAVRLPRRPFLLALAAALACTPRGERPAAPPAGGTAAVSDSAIPREVALRRFQAAVPRVDTLASPWRSRDALVEAFIAALRRQDTAALSAMTLTASEFGWLYYPTTPQGFPPYSLNADLMWFLIENRGARGLALLLQERGGRDLGYVGVECEGTPSREGGNVLWGPCLVRRTIERGQTGTERLFGLIIEREGRYKFVSFANRFD